jgi:hypothetical protein
MENGTFSYEVISLDRQYDQLDKVIKLENIFPSDWDTVILLNPYEERDQIESIPLADIVDAYNLKLLDDRQLLLFARNKQIVGVLPIFSKEHDFYLKVVGNSEIFGSRNVCLKKPAKEVILRMFFVGVCQEDTDG